MGKRGKSHMSQKGKQFITKFFNKGVAQVKKFQNSHGNSYVPENLRQLHKSETRVCASTLRYQNIYENGKKYYKIFRNGGFVLKTSTLSDKI